MRRWLSLSIIVGLVGCTGSGMAIPDDDAADHFGNIPSFVLPTAPPALTPPSPAAAPEEDDESPPPTKKKKKKKTSPTVGDGTSDSSGDTWVDPELEVDEPPPAPVTSVVPLPPPPTPPLAPPSGEPIVIDTEQLTTKIPQGTIYVGDINAQTAQPVDCPPDMVATGVSLVYDANDIITGFQGISCRPLSNDGTLGTLTIVGKELGSTQIPPGGASASLGCSGKRTDGIMDGYTVRYENGAITQLDLRCKSLLALWYQERIAWTVRFAKANYVHETAEEMQGEHRGCGSNHGVVSLHVRDNGQQDATGRLTGIGRICALLKHYTDPPVVTSSDQQPLVYSTEFWGGPKIHVDLVIHTNYAPELNSPHFNHPHFNKPYTIPIRWGGEPSTLQCDADNVAIGLLGWAGLDIDALGLVCKNRYSGKITKLGPNGAESVPNFEHLCPQEPDQTILRGARIVVGSYSDSEAHVVVKQLRIACATLYAPGDLIWGDQTAGSTELPEDDDILHTNDIIVPVDHAITALQLRTGDRVDAMAFTYERQPWYLPNSERYAVNKTHTTGLAGAMGGGESPPVRCPYGQVAVGLYGRKGADIDAVGLVCHNPSQPDVDNWRSPVTGGGGGGNFDILCPEGSVVQNVSAVAEESVLVALRLGCASILRNGTHWSVAPHDVEWPQQSQVTGSIASPWNWTQTVGVPTDGNHVITGLRIRAGDRVDAIGLFYHALE